MQGVAQEQQQQLAALQGRLQRQRAVRHRLECHLKDLFRELTASQETVARQAAELAALRENMQELDSKLERAVKRGSGMSQELKAQLSTTDALKVCECDCSFCCRCCWCCVID